MQVSVETTSGLERKITVGVESKNINTEINKRLQHLARTQKMSGFRPGKIPMSVVKKRFGAPVRQEVLQAVMQRSYFEALAQEKIQPAGQPLIEPGEIVEGKDFEFTATFEVFPEITVNDFAKLKIERATAEVTDKDLEKMIETLQKQRGEWVPIKRMAKKGDMIVIDFDGSIDGEAFDGGKAEDFSLTLGTDSMIPGFEKQLLKVKTGEERDIEVSFPEDYQAKELAGKDALFHVVVKEVKGVKLPKIDDDFVKLFGIEEGGIDKLKEEISNNMKRELDLALKAKVKSNVLESLNNDNEVDIPRSLVDQEIESLRQQSIKQMNKGRTTDLNEMPEMPAALFEDQANSRVKLALLVNEIIKTNDIKADPERLKSTIENIASAYDEPEQMVSWYYSNKEQLQQVESSVIEEQVVDFVLESAKVKDKKCTFDEIMNKQA